MHKQNHFIINNSELHDTKGNPNIGTALHSKLNILISSVEYIKLHNKKPLESSFTRPAQLFAAIQTLTLK